MTTSEIRGILSELRKTDEAFDSLVTEITSKIEQQIKERNEVKSFKPTNSCDHYVRIKVKAVPMTKRQKSALLDFLRVEYNGKVAGSYFTMKKCWLSEEYLVKSRYCDY